METSLKRNYLYNLSYQLFVIVVPLITTPYVSRVLGKYNIGIFGFEQSVVNYFILFGCIGLNLYGQRGIAFCNNDIIKRSRVFWELMIIRTVALVISIIVFLLVIVRNSEYPVYYMLFGVELFASLFDISWFFQGIENFIIQVKRNFIIKTTSVICIFVFVKNENQLWIYIICYTAAVLLGNISIWAYLPKQICKIELKTLNPIIHLIPAIILFLPQISTAIYTQLDKTMLGLLSPYDQVGIYGQAEKVVKLALTIVTSLGYVMLSRIAISFANNDKKKITEYIEKSFKFLFFLSLPIMLGVMAISNRFVPWFFGSGYEQVIPCMIVLSPIIFFIGFSNVLGTQYLLPTDQMKDYTISILVGVVINIICNYLLIPSMGCIGASLATVFAETMVAFTQFIFTRKEYGPRIFIYGIKNLISAIFMAVIIMIIGNYMRPDIITTLIQILIGMGIYFVMLFVLKDEFFMMLCDNTFSKIKKKS